VTEYILILTLVTLTDTGAGIANSIDNIPGFASQEECQQAANAWLKEVRKLSRTAESNATCVKQRRS
jgi:hypothetical protein